MHDWKAPPFQVGDATKQERLRISIVTGPCDPLPTYTVHTHKYSQLTTTLCWVPLCQIIMITGAFITLHKDWLTSSVATLLTALSLSNSMKNPTPQFLLLHTHTNTKTHTHTRAHCPFKCTGAVSNLEGV